MRCSSRTTLSRTTGSRCKSIIAPRNPTAHCTRQSAEPATPAIRLKSYQYHMRRSVGAAKPRARVQKFLRVDRLAVDAGLVMQVRTGRAAGGADLAQHLADRHRLPDPDVDRGKMSIAGGEAVAVVELDHLAVAATPAGGRHRAVRRGADRIAYLRVDIQSRVHGGGAEERIDARAEARHEVDLAHDRLADRHMGQRAREPIDLAADDVDALDLALEGAGIGRRARRDEGATGPASSRARRDLAGIDAERGEHAAHAVLPGIVILLDRIEGCGLARFDPVERGLQARERPVDAAA